MTDEMTDDNGCVHNTPKCDKAWIACNEVEKLQRSMDAYSIPMDTDVVDGKIEITIDTKEK